MMTTSQRHRPDSSAPRLRALGRSAHNLFHEHVYAWERYFRAGLPPRAGAGRSASARDQLPAELATCQRIAVRAVVDGRCLLRPGSRHG